MQNVKIEPFKMIGLSIMTTNQNGKAAQDIASLWNKFLGESIVDKIPNKVDSTIYSLYTDYEGDHLLPYRVILGCKVSDLAIVPEGMIAREFQGGSYVKTVAKGDLTQGLIVNHWSKLWEMTLDRKYSADFEVFGEKAQNPLDAEVEFFVAVN